MIAIFDLPSADAAAAPLPRVSLSYAWEFACDGETPGRVLNDEGVRALIPFLRGPGKIVELGGVGDY